MIYVDPTCTAFDDLEIENAITVNSIKEILLHGQPIGSVELGPLPPPKCYGGMVTCITGRRFRLAAQAPFTLWQMAVMTALAQLSFFARATGITGPKLMEGDPCYVLSVGYFRTRIVGPKQAPMGDGPYWNLRKGVWRAAAVGVETEKTLVVESSCELLIGSPYIRDNVIERGKYL